MSYHEHFLSIVNRIKEEDNIAAILLIGKTAKVPEDNFDQLNDVDLLVVYENNRDFERQVEMINGVPFDISYISIFDLITQVEGRSIIWINMIMGAKIYFAKNELIFGIIDRVKDIYLSGTGKLSEEDVEFIRFKLSQQLVDIENRTKDVILASFLMHQLFNQSLENYYALNAMWLPNPKNMIENLEVIDENLSKMVKDFIFECTSKRQHAILIDIVDYVLEPFGGRLLTWKKGHYHISQ